ncbi:unnamed protein product [Protopolystoma xenopodis]|uniref:Uncharacterized protein n=1 Tax=Protopolystoma xenopodis TaxID=117903 RepID=A0A3S5A6B0_9PLAT|nr:unnamed protein product [Protopolystoma xenopodis]
MSSASQLSWSPVNQACRHARRGLHGSKAGLEAGLMLGPFCLMARLEVSTSKWGRDWTRTKGRQVQKKKDSSWCRARRCPFFNSDW